MSFLGKLGLGRFESLSKFSEAICAVQDQQAAGRMIGARIEHQVRSEIIFDKASSRIREAKLFAGNIKSEIDLLSKRLSRGELDRVRTAWGPVLEGIEKLEGDNEQGLNDIISPPAVL